MKVLVKDIILHSGNNKYYFQNDHVGPVEILSLDEDKYNKTTTFVLYEKVNIVNIVDIIKNCNQ
jgi:hypothetical protein